MNEVQLLTQRIEKLEGILNNLVKSDRYVYQKHIQMMDGRNVQFALGTGTKIGTAPTQKLAFHGAIPVVQAAAITPPSGGVTVDSAARTAIGLIITVLHDKGLTA